MRLPQREQDELKASLHEMIDAWDITDFQMRTITREINFGEHTDHETISQVDTGVRVVNLILVDLILATRPDPEVQVVPVHSVSVNDDAYAYEFEEEESGTDAEHLAEVPTRDDERVLSRLQVRAQRRAPVARAAQQLVTVSRAAVSFVDRAVEWFVSMVFPQRPPRA